MNLSKISHDPVYQAILQTHNDSVKRYLSLAPTHKTSTQKNSNTKPASLDYEDNYNSTQVMRPH